MIPGPNFRAFVPDDRTLDSDCIVGSGGSSRVLLYLDAEFDDPWIFIRCRYRGDQYREVYLREEFSRAIRRNYPATVVRAAAVLPENLIHCGSHETRLTWELIDGISIVHSDLAETGHEGTVLDIACRGWPACELRLRLVSRGELEIALQDLNLRER